MKLRKPLALLLLTIFSFSLSISKEDEGTPIAKIERLKSQIEEATQNMRGVAGISLKHLESGEALSINDDIYFPMASVFKIPILIEVMAQVEEGKLSLEEEVEIKKSDQHLGSGMISDYDVPGIKLSIRNLINLMMIISDNSATDILLNRVGIENINKRLHDWGIEEITVNRTCQNIIIDFMGLDLEKYKDLSSKELMNVYLQEKKKNPDYFTSAEKKFSSILKDQATPRAMNRLLEMIFKKEILEEQSCEHILSVMLRCQTGEKRIKGQLPPHTKVAHKTGTIGGTVNDSGIIYLPYGLGHVAITVFTKDMEHEMEKVEELIAHISRFVYDYFCFTL